MGLLHPQERLMEQLRRRRQIPIGVGDVAVTKIGRQLWQVPFDIDAVAIPAQQRRHGQTMAKIVQAGTAGIVGAAQADFTGKFDERPTDGPFGQTRPTFGKKEAWADRTRAPSVAAPCIGLQGLLR